MSDCEVTNRPKTSRPVTLVLVLGLALSSAQHARAYTMGACDGNPCMNGGNCVDMGTEENPKQFTCACAEGYTGLTCQKRIDPCAEEPCQNGGICEPRGEHFHCSCSDRFKGRLCELYIRKRNPCLGDPCGSHGYCEVVNYDFLCECSPGYHGTRCEFGEDDDDDDREKRDELLVAAVQESDSAAALLIGEVVLGILLVFGVILILLSIHWMRVANRRSRHKAAQELRIASGKEPECTPGWFETSNELCYDFFCYCCKLVNKWENDGKIIINCDDPNARECFERCCGGCKGGSAVDIAVKRSMDKVPSEKGLVGANSPRPPSKAPSAHGETKTSSQPASGSRSPVQQSIPPPSMMSEDQGNLSANQYVDDECWACLPRDWSQNRAAAPPAGRNRAAGPRYGAARNYPVMPSKYGQQNNSGTDIKMVDSRSSMPTNVGRRTARGALPGFQPCPDYLLNEATEDGDGRESAPRAPPNVIRVRRRTPPGGKSNRAVVDILDGKSGPNYLDGDDDFDDEEDNEEGVMVGPRGNVLAMPFRNGAVGMQRLESGNVDPMYFDENYCSNQSNSFGAYSYDESCPDVNKTNTSSGHAHTRESRSRRSVHRNNHADHPDDSEDTENDGSDADDDKEEEPVVESAEDGATDDDDNDELFIPSPRRQASRRRPRRYFSRRSRGSQRDDGYSSTGRVSESDAGGRSRDPISMEAATKQAYRNFYSRQARQPFHPNSTQPPPPPYPLQSQGMVRRKDLPDITSARKHLQGGPGITLSPHPASPGTRPVFYSNCPSPAQPGFQPPKCSSPYTVAGGTNDQVVAPPQYYQPQQQQQQLKRESPAFPRRALQGYSDRQLHNNMDRVFDESHPRGGTPSSRRPRHSLRGWDRSARGGATVPHAYASEHSSYETTTPNPAVDQRLPPVRKPKVKGILKKTSAYGSSNPTRGSGWASCDGRARPSSTDGYGYNAAPNGRRSWRYPSPHLPHAYDQFVV